MRDYFGKRKKQTRRRRIIAVLCAVVLIVCLVQLGLYVKDHIDTVQQQQALSAMYHRPAESGQADEEVPKTPITPQQETLPETLQNGPAEDQYDTRLTGIVYPDNPRAIFSTALYPLWQQNHDIRGWLNVDELVDSAVVLRDNTFYLNHGVNG